MELHNYQEARLKLFEDPHLRKIWLHPRGGDKPFPLPASKITTESDFQTPALESFQQKIETRAAPAFKKLGRWDEREYIAITEWAVLHLIRNRKSRREFFGSNEDYNKRFVSEFDKELKLSRQRYPIVDRYESNTDRFFITSDHPVVELHPLEGTDYLRCFAVSPKILLWFSARQERPQFEIAIEDYFNAMVFASCDEFVFSHRQDMHLQRLAKIADEYEMFPVIEG
ncbi:MAG: hypothetical protein DLM73_05365 [Chthoniobacterales bacterium]|nr:MAG: hypothetical protein DLM73_05365 [Chthoniobacterales bacterium]